MTNTLHSAAPVEAIELDKMLRDGAPTFGWRGDPRLRLTLGVVTAKDAGWQGGKFFRKGDVVGISAVVMRQNEDGTDTPILQRRVAELHTIIPALIESDPRTPGFRDVMDRVEGAHDKIEAEKSTEFREAHGEMVEHLWNIVAERENGKTFFGQVGKDA